MSRCLCAFLLGLICVCPAEAAPDAKVRQKLYVTSSAGDDVTVIDVASNKPIGRIEVGPHPHGIAVPAAADFLLVTIEGRKPGELVWIDPQTDRITRRMDVGPAPNQLAVTPDGKTAFVPCEDGYWDVVDVGKAKVQKRIYTGGRPHNTLRSPDGKHMYLAPMGSPKKVFIVDVAKQEIVGEIPFSNVVRPIALDAEEKRLYAEVDGLVGIEVADIAQHKMIHRVQADLPNEQRKVASRSHGLGIRPDQKEIWECDVEHHDVHIYDITGDTPKQIATVPIGSRIYWLTFSPNGKTCYVSARGANAVSVVDTATKKVTARIPAGKEPKRLIVVNVPEKAAQ
jgi:YVTN family beta-propeller protein